MIYDWDLVLVKNYILFSMPHFILENELDCISFHIVLSLLLLTFITFVL